MSKDSKFFVRPKVRFSQATKSCIEDSKNLAEQKDVRSDKPKIRSIVVLDKPIKIVNLHKASSNNGLKKRGINGIDDVQKPECSDELCSKVSLHNNYIQVDNQKSLSNSSSNQNVKAQDEKIKVFNEEPTLTIPILEEENDIKMQKSQNNDNISVSKEGIKIKGGKENERLVVKKDISNAAKNKTTSKYLTHRIKKQCNDTKTDEPQRCINTPAKITVMPCHKYNSRSKSKTSPVKKTIIRNIRGSKIKPTIGPGMPRKKQDHLQASKTKENLCAQQDKSGKKFARPEYNSIILSINKLNKVQKQNVTDIDHLPCAYKNLVNEKMSSALDFPLNEAIYKNLIELSIDEKQLPSRLMRSKDPEPRLRDIDPVLSDFFTPISSEEYCAAITVKPRTPEILENWSAFSVSEKIFEWKHNMNHV